MPSRVSILSVMVRESKGAFKWVPRKIRRSILFVLTAVLFVVTARYFFGKGKRLLNYLVKLRS